MQKKNLIFLIVCIFLAIGAGVGAEIFFSKTMSLKNEIKTLNADVAALKIQADRLVSLRQVANTTGDELLQLNDFFVAPSGALDFVKYIELLAGSSGLSYKIDLFETQEDPVLAEQGKQLLRSAVRTTGTMKNTRIFLSLIESLPYNVKISRVDLRRTVQGTAQVTVPKDEWSMVIDFTVIKVIEK